MKPLFRILIDEGALFWILLGHWLLGRWLVGLATVQVQLIIIWGNADHRVRSCPCVRAGVAPAMTRLRFFMAVCGLAVVGAKGKSASLPPFSFHTVSSRCAAGLFWFCAASTEPGFAPSA